MAIKDIQDKAMQGYNQSLKVGSAVYAASEPYRATGKSIIAAAKGNLFEFPVFISSSVQLDYATATTSLLEQVYASYLQSALSLNPIVDEALVRNKTPFAKFQSDTNRYVEYTDMDYAHDAVHNAVVMEDGNMLEFTMMSIEDADGRVILEQYAKRPLSEFDHYFLEAYNPDPKGNAALAARNKRLEQQLDAAYDLIDKMKATGKQKRDEYRVKEAEVRDGWNKINAAQQAIDDEKSEIKKEIADLDKQKKDFNKDVSERNQRFKEKEDATKALHALEEKEKELDYTKKNYELAAAKFGYQMQKDAKDAKREDEKAKFEKQKFRHTVAKDRLAEDRANRQERRDEIDANFKHAVKTPELLDETKIKKLNTMKPLMMNVQFNIQDKNGTISAPINYVVAVKTFNRIIDADTLPEVVEYPLKEMNKVARKAKWRAGELKFFRDIVFKVKQKKQTAVDSRDPKRKWYRRLYELAHMSGDAPTKAAIKGKNITWSVVKSQIEDDFDYGVIPNASLIISNNDVINIKSKTGLDLLNGGTATKFCKELFLISLVVIDTDAESIKILLPDNHDDYEVHSLASVNKQLAELSTAGSKTRDIFKLLG